VDPVLLNKLVIENRIDVDKIDVDKLVKLLANCFGKKK
jgi:hypothetical protein